MPKSATRTYQWDWETESDPCNGTSCVVKLRDGRIALAHQQGGEWCNSHFNHIEYGETDQRGKDGVVGWVWFDQAPLVSLSKEQLIALLREGEAKFE